MISIFKKLIGDCIDTGNPKSMLIGQHDSGIFCYLDVYPNSIYGRVYTTKDFVRSSIVVIGDNQGQVLEELDKYINENPDSQYIYEYPDPHVTSFTEVPL